MKFLINFIALAFLLQSASALEMSCPSGQTCVAFSSSDQARITQVATVRELANLAHAWQWQGEDTLKELFNQVVQSDALSRIFPGGTATDARYMRCIQSSSLRTGDGETVAPSSACQRLFDRVERAAPGFNARAQTAARHIMFSSVALNACQSLPGSDPLGCLPGSPSRLHLEALNQRMANGIPIALGDSASTDTSFDVFARGRPSLRELRAQSDPDALSTDDLTIALTLREPESEIGRETTGAISASLGESAPETSETFGTSDGSVFGIYEAQAITNCPMLATNPFVCVDSNGSPHPIDEATRNQLLGIYTSMRNPLLDMASRYLAVGTVTGYFNRMLLMPHINPSNIDGVAIAIRNHCPASSSIHTLVTGSANQLAHELRAQGETFSRNQTARHNQMIADAIRLNELTNNLQALNADFPGTIEGLASVWPAWLPGGMTIARMVDLGVVAVASSVEHHQRPCGFYRGGGIGAIAIRNLAGGAAGSSPLTDSSGDRFLRERSLVSSDHPGNEYERCEAKRRLINVYSNEAAEILARSPALAESREEGGRDPIFRAIARQRFGEDTDDRAILGAQRAELTAGLGANFHRISDDLESYIEELCRNPREQAEAMMSDPQSLNRLFSCGGLAPVPVDLANPATVGIDGRPLPRECQDMREMAPAGCLINQVASDRNVVQEVGLQNFAFAMDAVGVVGMGMGIGSVASSVATAGLRTGMRAVATGLLEHIANPARFAMTAASAGVGVGLGMPGYYSALRDRRDATACFYSGDCPRERYDQAVIAAQEAEEHLIRDALIGVFADVALSVHAPASRATPDLDVTPTPATLAPDPVAPRPHAPEPELVSRSAATAVTPEISLSTSSVTPLEVLPATTRAGRPAALAEAATPTTNAGGGTRVTGPRGRRARAVASSSGAATPTAPVRAQTRAPISVAQNSDSILSDLIIGDRFHFADSTVGRVARIEGANGVVHIDMPDGSSRRFFVDDLIEKSGLRFESSRRFVRTRPTPISEGGVRLSGGSVTFEAPVTAQAGNSPASVTFELPEVSYRMDSDPVASARAHLSESGVGTLGDPLGNGGMRTVFEHPSDSTRVVKVYDVNRPALRALTPEVREAYIANLIQRELAMEDMMVRIRQSYLDRGLPAPFEIARIDRNPELLRRGIIVQERMTGTPLSQLDDVEFSATFSEVASEYQAMITAFDNETADLFEQRLGIRLSNADNPRLGFDIGVNHENLMVCSAGGRRTLCIFDY